MKMKLLSVNLLRSISGKCIRNLSNSTGNELHNNMPKGNVQPIILNPTVLKEQSPNFISLKRARVKTFALLLSYKGNNYHGLQMCPQSYASTFTTIEAKLFQALVSAHLINDHGVVIPHIYDYGRGSRTDKGVSAIRNVVSMRLPCHIPTNEMIDSINTNLPEDIRVHGICRVPRNFNPRHMCTQRGYIYVCPSYTFAPIEQLMNQDYRIPNDQLDKLKSLLNDFCGKHNFHNYTSKRYFRDISCQRTIISINIDEPFIKGGHEWLRIKILGGSFMLHQIRKMIGMAVARSKNFIDDSTFNVAWENCKLHIPKAPALGLVLDHQDYKGYQKLFKNDFNHILNWEEYEDKTLEFRDKYIESFIIDEEIKTKSMLEWLSNMPLWEYNPYSEENADKTRVWSSIGKAKFLVKDSLSRLD